MVKENEDGANLVVGNLDLVLFAVLIVLTEAFDVAVEHVKVHVAELLHFASQNVELLQPQLERHELSVVNPAIAHRLGNHEDLGNILTLLVALHALDHRPKELLHADGPVLVRLKVVELVVPQVNFEAVADVNKVFEGYFLLALKHQR